MSDRVPSICGRRLSPIVRYPLSHFLVVSCPCVDTRGPSVVLDAVDVPYPEPIHFFLTLMILCTTLVVSLTYMLVILSSYAMLIKLPDVLVWAKASLFFVR